MPDSGLSVNATGLRRAALLNDLSCFGKCSLTVGLPILASAGVEALPVPTALLSTHTGGFEEYTCCELTPELEKILRHWQSLQLHLDAIATGYFCSAAQLAFAARFARAFAASRPLLLVDPVMGDGGRLYPGFDAAFVEGMRGLCRGAGVITPNLTEALLLAGLPGTVQPTAENVQLCLQRLLAAGAQRVVITGVPRTPQLAAAFEGTQLVPAAEDGQIGYLCADEQRRFAVWHPVVHTSLHGCGDVFSAALLAAALGAPPGGPVGVPPACALSRGEAWFRPAVTAAARFTFRCVQATMHEQYPGHWYGLRLEACLTQGFCAASAPLSAQEEKA